MLALSLSSCSPEGGKLHQGIAVQLPKAPGMNVLVVSFDALRADGMGLYGYHRNTTPNLDHFAQQALVFDNAYASAPITPTSFASVFTGQYPYRVFIRGQLIATTTLAQVMADSGRATFGLMNNVQLAPERNFAQGFDQYQAENLTDETLLEQAKERLSALKDTDRSFFGWVHFASPHTPYTHRDISDHLAPIETEGRFSKKVPAHFDVKNEAELERARALYDGEVFFADYLFGQLLEHLQELDLIDKTIVVVTADHGEEFKDHDQLGHKTLFEEVIRIPLLIRHPDANDGARTTVPYLNIDLLPMLTSMVGIEPLPGIDGLDLRAPFPAPRTRVMTNISGKKRLQIAVEQGGRKLIQICYPEFREELYDLATDPGEHTNIVLDHPDLANTLADALIGITHAEPCQLIFNTMSGTAPEELLNPEQIEQLKSLGYIQ